MEGRPLEDSELIERARRGDLVAYGELVQRHQEVAVRTAYLSCGDATEAEDAAQEGFLKAYAGLARFEGRSGFYTWLYRLVFNQCIDMKRRDRSARHEEWDDEIARDAAPGANIDPLPLGTELADPANAYHRGQLREALAAAIESLPDDARRTLVLREVEGLSYEEIARALRIPKGTVMSRLHYARRRVRDTLIANGAVEAAESDAETEDGETDE